ncbi:D-alanyl-D-alanine carboxypeptidase/D-alanyl-D-alanine endopeptidase [Phytoactinopolyspora mesophila]|uniref:D-alanyl-D-alanine carboxypeptidase/D-alanyl-D-alanine-endopeptidase n=1 Tax=Phytoactinopolyspora mesophila TaxID=2650750 RepID=A0A7K3MBU2_9ACTN|nr:D-alanyl-D-alanine carboxypeptidase/D-alanyl-D-alanine-endopeptidase [Phytoactinopolyspora mesophila]NDL60779.1 D-alanyl-D-alanine carboxypeptidase/D-alanyl-D-alanine-endopeptidase [Phytoactinopolyspora mesophila]
MSNENGPPGRARFRRAKPRRVKLWVAVSVAATAVLVSAVLVGTGQLTPTDGPPKASQQLDKALAASWEPAEAVLAAAGPDADTGADLSNRLASLAGASELGGNVGAVVIDLGSGATIYESNATDAFVPASTMKILTSVAVLDVLGPDHRFETKTVLVDDDAGEVTIALVGGGDPMLASTDDGAVSAASASLEGLAAATAEAVAETGAESVRLTFDDSLFTGPAIDPDWLPTYVPNGVVAPVSALAADGGRIRAGFRDRADDPALSAAELFAGFLADHDVPVADASPERTDAGADLPELAAVASPPLSAIVEHVMRTSDNDAAEVLGRHVALGLGRPATSNEAGEATVEVLAGLGIEPGGLDIRDGSGLARGNAATAAALTSALGRAADPDHPDLRTVLAGLPVAGFTGTLAERAPDGSAGYVRAKTGTLTGVHSLAGLAVAPDGAAYIFAILADDADDALAARAALDRFAAALVS